MKRKWEKLVVFCLIFSMLCSVNGASAVSNTDQQNAAVTKQITENKTETETNVEQKEEKNEDVVSEVPKEVTTVDSGENDTSKLQKTPVAKKTQAYKSTLKIVENRTIEYGTDSGISRAAWVHDLAVIFDMTVEEDNYPDVYYPDVTEDTTYFRDIMMGIEFGIIDIDLGENFEPDKLVDREFAVHTLNYCLKYQVENETYTFSDSESVQYPDDAQVALDRNWLASINGAFCPKQNVTKSEVTKMLTEAQQVYASTEVDTSHKNTYTYASGVVEVPESVDVEIQGDDSNATISIDNDTIGIEKNTKFVVYQNQIPLGYQADSVDKADGKTTVKANKLDSDDVIVDVNAEGSVQADLADLTPAEGVRLTPVYDADTQVSQQSARTNKGAAVGIQQQDFNVQVPLISGATLTAAGTLYDLKLEWKSNSAEKSLVLKGHAKVTYTTNLNGNELAGIPKSINLCYLDIAGVGSFTISLDATISGSIGCSYVTTFTSGVQYSKGSGFRLVSSFHKEKFSFNLEASTKIALTAALSAKNIPGFTARVYAEAGIVSKSMVDIYSDGKKPTKCQHFASYMFADAGGNMEVKHVKSWSTKYVIWDVNNSPVRTEQHYEDGKGVSKCTRNAQKYCSIWSSMKWGMAWPKDASGIWLDEQGEAIPVFTYTLDALGNATITGYTANPRIMVIPEKVDDHPVIAVGKAAFKDKTNLVSVILPDSMERLEESCFEGCSSITAITIPNSVNQIDNKAFLNCSGLYEVTLPVNKKYTEIGANIFQGTSSLHTVNMSSYITKIGEKAFYQSGIESLNLPDDITFIGYQAFYGCQKLKTLHLPEYLETFGGCAFGGCDSLTAVTIPKHVKENEYYPDYHAVVDWDLEGGLFKNCSSLREVTFEDGTKKIGHNVLNGCTSVTKVNIPDTVTSIGMHAFNGCSSLEEISLPDALTEIDALAFRATGLKKIDIPDGVVKIDCLAFAVCESLSDVNMPKNLQQIGTWAFATCPKLTSIIIPKGTTTVLNYYNGLMVNTTESPFLNSNALQDVTLENGMKKVANSLFDNMTSIKKIKIPDTVTTIGDYCFYKAVNLEDVTLSKNLYQLGSKAFSACTSLERIVLPDTVGSMGESVFADCTLLSDVTLPKHRLNITKYTFASCTSLKEIALPEDTQYIREGAFKGCERLESITTPKNFIGISYEAFRDCKRLETAKITGKEIESSAFEGCQELTKVELSDTVTTIGSNAFKNCSSLSSITLSNGMTQIYEGTFDGCSVLNDVVVPYTVTEIQKNAFANCVSLSNITIPKRVEGIADTVFSYPDKVTIYGVTGSYAEEYADKQEMKFESNDVSAQSIQLSSSSYSRYNSLGNMQIPHTFTPANMASDVIWKSSDEEVATVNENGCVTTIGPGTCTIEVIAGSAQAKCSITVLPSVRGLSITGNRTMKAGEKSQLSYELREGSIPADEIRWISHDASAVSVDDTGLITAHTNGEVTIEAYWIRDTDDVRDEVTIKVTDNASGTTTPAPTTSTKPMPTTSAKPLPTASAKPTAKPGTTSNPSSVASSDKTNRPGTNGSNNANASGYKNKSVKAPAKVTGLKVKNIKKNKMKISWKWKVVGGYQIQYALNRKFTKQKKTVTVGKGMSTKTIKRLKKNKVYYVRVRAFNKSGGTKKYGKWSAVKKIRIKK